MEQGVTRTAVISINSCWNIQNFRRGLVKGLQDAGYRVIALAPHDEYSSVLSELHVQHVPIDMDAKGISPLRDGKLLLDYYRTLRHLRPSVYLSYTAKPNIYGSLASAALGIPSIANVSGLGSVFIEERWLAVLLRKLYRLAFRRSFMVFFQNPADRDLLVQDGVVQPDRTGLLPGSGIDLRQFQAKSEKVRHPGDPFTFILIARLLWDKGVREYVDAARMVKAELTSARFQMLGFLDAANRTAVRASDVQQWVDEGLIEYLGVADDVRPHIEAADCVVLPSYREGLPRVLLEAGAMAKPVIATDVPGCHHVVDDGINGFLCKVRDASSLSAQMVKIANLSSESKASMGQAARRKVALAFDEQIAIDRYMQAIEAAVSK
jgi:glycosyltransferase involved in cell wall biosynthesis